MPKTMRRLKPDPVPDELINKILQAASGRRATLILARRLYSQRSILRPGGRRVHDRDDRGVSGCESEPAPRIGAGLSDGVMEGAIHPVRAPNGPRLHRTAPCLCELGVIMQQEVLPS
jgi:hypothetical protein